MAIRNGHEAAPSGSVASSYATPEAWREAALARPVGVDAGEMRCRREAAAAHHQQYGLPDADALADQELYIQGRMELAEYRDYLTFKFMYGVE